MVKTKCLTKYAAPDVVAMKLRVGGAMIQKFFSVRQGVSFDRLTQDYVVASFSADWHSNASLEFAKNIFDPDYNGITDAAGNHVAFPATKKMVFQRL